MGFQRIAGGLLTRNAAGVVRCLSEMQAEELYACHYGRTFFRPLCASLTEGPSTALALAGRGAIEALQRICVPSAPAEAQKTAPDSLCAELGVDDVQNGVHCAGSHLDAERELELLLTRHGVAVQRARMAGFPLGMLAAGAEGSTAQH